MSVVALVLAAGSSLRFGGDKRRALMADGRSLLVHSVERACAVFEEVRVVLRAGERAEALGLPSACRVISSVDCARGMGHSLAAGAASLADCAGGSGCVGRHALGGARHAWLACTPGQCVNDSPALACRAAGPSGVVRP